MPFSATTSRRPRAAPASRGEAIARNRQWSLLEDAWREATRAARLWARIPASPLIEDYPLVRECLASGRWDGVSPTLAQVLRYAEVPRGPRIRERADRIECLMAAHARIRGDYRRLGDDEHRLHEAYVTVARSDSPPIGRERGFAEAERAASRELVEQNRRESVRSGLPVLAQLAIDYARVLRDRPYSVGNARMARLLIQDGLTRSGIVEEPILFLSEYLSRTREEGSRRLRSAGRTGDWAGWIEYFLVGIVEVAGEVAMFAERVLEREFQLRSLLPIVHRGKTGEFLLEYCSSVARCTLEGAVAETGLPSQQIHAAWKRFRIADWLRPVTRRPDCQVFVFQPWKELLLGTLPIAEA